MAQTKKQVRLQQQAEAQARNAAARAATAKATQRRKVVVTSAIGVAVVVVAAGVTIPLLAHGHSGSGLPKPQAAERDTLPPWAAPAHPLAAARAAGLRVNAMEGSVRHFHAHLDVIVDGKPVTVPADIGIDTQRRQLSELHTHDATGVLHIEAPDAKHRYDLGQLFAEWDVRLDSTHLGGLVTGGGKQLTAYVGGKKVSGDPAGIELEPHEEIALVYGPTGAKVDVPKSYTFPSGE